MLIVERSDAGVTLVSVKRLQALSETDCFLIVITTKAILSLNVQLSDNFSEWHMFDLQILSHPGSTQFPYNPLTMRMLSSTPPTSIACAPPSMSQATTHQQNRIWEREPAPLLSAQYETLSDSDDWTMQIFFFLICGSKQKILFLTCAQRDFPRERGPHNEELMESLLNAFCTGCVSEDCDQEGWLTKDKYVKSF